MQQSLILVNAPVDQVLAQWGRNPTAKLLNELNGCLSAVPDLDVARVALVATVIFLPPLSNVSQSDFDGCYFVPPLHPS